MMKIKQLIFFLSFLLAQNRQMSALEIIRTIDKNMNAKSRILTSKMIVHGRRSSRTIESKTWVIGVDQAFTEYLSPPREAGTKMLKMGSKLWTYSPQTDRVIQISGHMLRQSVMGSDMSYNDMMENRPIQELYSASIQESVKNKLWPLGTNIKFIPGHGPESDFATERKSNPFVSDDVLGFD